jgi:WD40 repeat protein
MKKLLTLIITIGTVGNVPAMDPDDMPIPQKTVIIQTSDQKEFIVPVVDAQKIPTLNGMIDDIGEEQTMAIPLPSVDGTTFEYVLRLVNRKVTIEGIFVNPAIKISDQAEFHDRRLSQMQLIKLNNACEFLGLEAYLPELVDKLKKSDLEDNSLKHLLPTTLRMIWLSHPICQSILDLIGANVPRCTRNIQVSPDNHKVFSWSEKENKIKLWDLKNVYQQPHEIPHQHVDKIDADKDRLIVLNLRGTFKLWDLHNLDFPPLILDSVKHNQQPVIKDIHLTRKYIITAATNATRTSRVLKVLEAEAPHNLVLKLKSDTQVFYKVHFDGSQLISYSQDGSLIKIFDMDNPDQSPRELGPYPPIQAVKNVVISSDDCKIAFSNDRQIAVINMQDPVAHPYALLLPIDEPINCIEINSRINKLIAWNKPLYGCVSNPNSTIKIWDMNQLDNPPHTIRVLHSVVANPHTAKLITWDGNVIQIFNLENPVEKPHKIHTNKGWDKVIISPNGKKLITAERITQFSMTLKIWNLENISEWPQILRPIENLQEIIISPDSSKLITSNPQGTKIWDMNACNQLQNLNYDQIQLMTWLHHKKNRSSNAVYSPELLNTYRSLPPELKHDLRASFSDQIKLLLPSLKRKLWLGHRWTS